MFQGFSDVRQNETMSDSQNRPPVAETMQFVPRKDTARKETAKQDIDSLATGTELGHYIIKKFIGGGGMGRVYLATDTALDRDVAVKILNRQRTNDPGIVSRFMNEAKSAARLNHEHIAQVYFAGETSGIPYIAFEYVEGINVRAMVEDHGLFPLPLALNYLIQIANALAHAALHGVIHRDVKPSNIIITRSGRAKLIDMGLARLSDTAEGRGDLTASGVTLGTFDYISPEQARDPRNADIRSDIYSLGCTFFFMLTGRPPFPEGTVLQKLLQHQGDAPPDIRTFQPSVPAEIAFIMQKMMAKDPKQRFQTPAVLIESLSGIARRLGVHQTEKGNLMWTTSRLKRPALLKHVPWMAAVILLLLGFFLLTLFSGPFHSPLQLPNISESGLSVSQIADSLPESVEMAVVSPPSSSDIGRLVSAFVPHGSPHPTGLRPAITGGSLRPSLEGAGVSSGLANVQFQVSDIQTSSHQLTSSRTAVPGAVATTSRRTVDPADNTPGVFSSLTSALNDAPDGTTIELRWNGPRRITTPIRLDNRKLNFVAAEGYSPILLFEPSELQSIRSFFAVFSSDIEFHHVGIEIHPDPTIVSSHWSLFELIGNTRLLFHRCLLTVRNKSLFDDSVAHEHVVFFRSGIPTGGTEEAFHVESPAFAPLSITATDTLFRGEAVLIQSEVSQDMQIQLTNSIVALARPFLQVEESRRALVSTRIQVQWDRVLFLGRQGFALLFKELTSGPAVIDFESQRSIFVLNRSPFVFFRDIRSEQRALDEFRWSGGVGNYFQDVMGLRFWTASSAHDAGTAYHMSLQDWRERWTPELKDQTKINALILNDLNKPMSRYLPHDVLLLHSADSVPWPDFDWFPTHWLAD